jgi:hypothetical protein
MSGARRIGQAEIAEQDEPRLDFSFWIRGAVERKLIRSGG